MLIRLHKAMELSILAPARCPDPVRGVKRRPVSNNIKEGSRSWATSICANAADSLPLSGYTAELCDSDGKSIPSPDYASLIASLPPSELSHLVPRPPNPRSVSDTYAGPRVPLWKQTKLSKPAEAIMSPEARKALPVVQPKRQTFKEAAKEKRAAVLARARADQAKQDDRDD